MRVVIDSMKDLPEEEREALFTIPLPTQLESSLHRKKNWLHFYNVTKVAVALTASKDTPTDTTPSTSNLHRFFHCFLPSMIQLS